MKNLNNLKIVLAEDDFVTQILTKSLLADLGGDVVIVEDGKQLVDLLKIEEFDLILVDLGLPLMNGFEAILEIKKHQLSSAQIIVLTAEDRNEEYGLLFENFDLSVIQKPMDVNELLSILAGEKNKSKTETETEKNQLPLFSLEKLEEMSRGNKQFVDKMVDLFKQEIPKSIVQINEMLAIEDYERIRALVHRIKPSIKMMCVVSIEQDVQKLEIISGNKSELEKIPKLVNKISLICNKVVASL